MVVLGLCYKERITPHLEEDYGKKIKMGPLPGAGEDWGP